MFQTQKDNAPACLTLSHYTELMDDKGKPVPCQQDSQVSVIWHMICTTLLSW